MIIKINYSVLQKEGKIMCGLHEKLQSLIEEEGRMWFYLFKTV